MKTRDIKDEALLYSIAFSAFMVFVCVFLCMILERMNNICEQEQSMTDYWVERYDSLLKAKIDDTDYWMEQYDSLLDVRIEELQQE